MSSRRGHFALFRLVPIPFEHYAVAIWITLTVACWFAADLFATLPQPLPILLGVVAATIAIQIPVVGTGLIVRSMRVNSIVIMTLMIAAAVYYARHPSWARFVAWQFLGFVALNTVLSHAMLVYATLRPNDEWFGPVVTRFETGANEIWLTIDDGPTPDTPAILDLFDRYDTKATFFVKGVLAQQHADFVRELISRGHSVGNHSQTHPSATFWCAPPNRVRAEIDECNRVLESITGAAPRWFRAPVGHKNPWVHPALARHSMRLIGLGARGFDAVVSDPDRVLGSILPNVKPGAIVVLHQGREHSLRVIEHVIASLHGRGYAFVIPRDEQLR